MNIKASMWQFSHPFRHQHEAADSEQGKQITYWSVTGFCQCFFKLEKIVTVFSHFSKMSTTELNNSSPAETAGRVIFASGY